jgi:hypothetical protein
MMELLALKFDVKAIDGTDLHINVVLAIRSDSGGNRGSGAGLGACERGRLVLRRGR